MHVLHMHVVILVCKSITPDQRIKAHLPKYDPLASQSAEEVSELSRLAQQQQWTGVQNAYLNASKACVIGRAIPFPTSNKGDPEAACQWDCWRRATMLEPLAWDVLHNGIAGDFIEAGVYKGGISVHMEALLHAFYSLRGTTTHAPRERVRQMWLADSFGGLPPSKAYNKQFAERDGGIRAGTDMESIAQAAKFEYAGARDWTPGKFASPLDAVKKRMLTCLSSTYSSRTHQPFPAMGTTESCGKSHIIIGPCMQVSTPPPPSPSTGTPEGGKEHGGFEEKGAEGDVLRQVRFLPGFFNETLHTMPPGSSFALIRADSDMFVSIYETLDALYPRLSGVCMLSTMLTLTTLLLR